MSRIAPYAKAVASALVSGATYIVASGFDYTSVPWWAGLVVFVGGAFGIVYQVPNKDA